MAECAGGGPGIINCTGNELDGVPNPPDGTSQLNVNSLTTNIAPAAGTRGINFDKAAGEDAVGQSFTITVNDSHSITTINAGGIIRF